LNLSLAEVHTLLLALKNIFQVAFGEEYEGPSRAEFHNQA
jgi:hypothetical protein